MELISIASAVLIGALLVWAADPAPDLGPRWAATVLRVALGASAGIGITSLVFLFLDIAGEAGPLTIFGSDAVLLAGAVLLNLRKPAAPTERAVPEARRFRWTWMLALAFGITALIVGARLLQIAEALPVGQWDAWAIWNLRAKFLAGPGSSWRVAVSPLLTMTHPDYPLLLSSFVARAWKASGTMGALAPLATAAVFFSATIAMLVSAVALLRGSAAAVLAGLVALSTTPLLVWSMAQYADIPAGFYCLGAVALILVDAASSGSRHWALLWAGLCASLAAWTKNEGIVLLACVLVVFVGVIAWRQGARAALRQSRLLFAGCLPGIVLVLWFKFFLAPAVDPLVRQGASGVGNLLHVGRYLEVATALVKEMVNLGTGVGHPLILLAILLIALRWQVEQRERTALLIGGLVVGLMLLSYCGVYLITPNDLAWQLQTSLGRLLLQIWSSALLLFFVVLRNVADAAPAVTSANKAAAPARNKGAVGGRKKAR